MFQIVNPNWKSASQNKAELHAPTVAMWLKDNAANRLITLAELRAGMPAIAADLTRPVVNQICCLLGLEVQGADDIAG